MLYKYTFLLPFHSNYGPILYRFPHRQVFHRAGNIWDTRGPGGLAAQRPLTAVSTITPLGHSGLCPISTRWRQTNEQIISI